MTTCMRALRIVLIVLVAGACPRSDDAPRDAGDDVPDGGSAACGDVVPAGPPGGVDEPCGAGDACAEGLRCLGGVCLVPCAADGSCAADAAGCGLGGLDDGPWCLPACDGCGDGEVCLRTHECGAHCAPPACEGDVCSTAFDGGGGGEGEGEGEAPDDPAVLCALRSRPCATGLECVRLEGERDGRCRTPGGLGAACRDLAEHDDGCSDGFECGDDGACQHPCGCEPPATCAVSFATCAAPGELGAPCAQDGDCNSGFCASDDTGARACGRSSECVVDADCDAPLRCLRLDADRVCGCTEDADCAADGTLCIANRCAPPLEEGEVCLDFGDDEDISRFPCAAGLECFVAREGEEASLRRCGVPAGAGGACPPRITNLAEDGCADGTTCVEETCVAEAP